MAGFLIGFGIAMLILRIWLAKTMQAKPQCTKGHKWKTHEQPGTNLEYLKCEECGWVFGTDPESRT
jgi:hypothetical protein